MPSDSRTMREEMFEATTDDPVRQAGAGLAMLRDRKIYSLVLMAESIVELAK
ncbi:hypothetical protein FOWG_17575 [Fusarium oxysporum f. sp. lycopersici MN25]|nr:hypothetical protein FOWG_17575 [Fusarium oxysporum f. sp. lycopersici MN25]